jgi:hypothetical protein
MAARALTLACTLAFTSACATTSQRDPTRDEVLGIVGIVGFLLVAGVTVAVCATGECSRADTAPPYADLP